ncbi:MAG: aspartate-semialdehyde dehydrogenase [Armatimonadetes bacterium]|nr:aspartate-semialdehyde dehydrogenase [Armatimonadota bacterium]
MSRTYHVAVLGATGAVGHEFVRLFEERNFPVGRLTLLASERSAGKEIAFRGEKNVVQAVNDESFAGVDFGFFSAGAGRSKQYTPIARAAGATVIDNSSAYRMLPEVPLVVPEINQDAMTRDDTLIAVANCTAIILCMALYPLMKLGKMERVTVSTYQSASGAGAAAMRELEDQTRTVLAGGRAEPKVMPHPYAFNLFSHNTAINELGYNEEEWKVIQETQKILGVPDLRLGVTCVRVPVLRAHCESVTVEFEGEPPTVEAIRAAMAASPGVKLVDDREGNHFPMPSESSGQGDVLVGRIRRDISHPNAIALFISGDQLLKGAALNAVQIAETILAKGYR